MRTISREELDVILDRHDKWMRNEEGGECADLSDTNLDGFDLHDKKLCGARMIGVSLKGANLSYTDLFMTDLSVSNLNGANLSYASLKNANLELASLREADLKEAIFDRANLYGAVLIGAKNIYTIRDASSAFFFPLQCPEEGEYIGFKKADEKIVKLLIPADAKRSSATTRKCRASKAKVLSITDFDGTPTRDIDEAWSDYDTNFVYRVGEIVEVHDFEEDRWIECAPGIHHFLTRQEAVEY